MSERRRTVQCPACMHEETMRARLNGGEPCHDDPRTMRWHPPRGGAGGQQCMPADHGVWVCVQCGLVAPPHAAGVLLDAALMHANPRCDSIVDGVHQDARDALKGGR